MSGEVVAIETPRGSMPVHLGRPAGGEGPLAVILMDAPGVRPALFEVAERLNEAGYLTALPDLYYALEGAARPDPARIAAGEEEAKAAMMAAVKGMRDEEVVTDLALLLAGLRERGVASGEWAAVGFCQGARFALRAAESEVGADLAAAALLHPTLIVTDAESSPHRLLDRIGAELYLAFGEADAVTPVEVVSPLREALESARVGHEIDVFEGAGHGFTLRGQPKFAPEAAAEALTATQRLLQRRLPA